uniref:Tri8 n=1 Tax=Kitasatospora aureofaciens TaxID=1894 RepID=A0A4P8XS45_KITAU|nr:Tri8 [Kitasatospora aureofaciens]
MTRTTGVSGGSGRPPRAGEPVNGTGEPGAGGRTNGTGTAARNGSAGPNGAGPSGAGAVESPLDFPLSAEISMLRQSWWLHDARWYQAVKTRFGQDVANELNAEVMRFVARRVATLYSRRHPTPPGSGPREVAATLQALARLMFTRTRVKLDATEFDDADGSWETVVSEHFALKMLAASRSLDGYECPCLQLRAGWFEGIGVTADDEVLTCMRDGAESCRFRACLT